MKDYDLTYQSFLYYQNECEITNPFDALSSEYRSQIQDGIGSIDEFLSPIVNNENSTEIMNITCRRDMTFVLQETRRIQNDLIALLQGLEDALSLARCARISPLYNR